VRRGTCPAVAASRFSRWPTPSMPRSSVAGVLLLPAPVRRRWSRYRIEAANIAKEMIPQCSAARWGDTRCTVDAGNLKYLVGPSTISGGGPRRGGPRFRGGPAAGEIAALRDIIASHDPVVTNVVSRTPRRNSVHGAAPRKAVFAPRVPSVAVVGTCRPWSRSAAAGAQSLWSLATISASAPPEGGCVTTRPPSAALVRGPVPTCRWCFLHKVDNAMIALAVAAL